MKKVKIPIEAANEIRRLQWQIEKIMLDLTSQENKVDALKKENILLKEELKRYEQPN